MSTPTTKNYKAARPSAHPVPQRVIDTFWTKVEVREDDECWPWQLSAGGHGYGQVGWDTGMKRDNGNRINAMTTAHRVAWIAWTGQPIPSGMTIDHLCRNRLCCNPHHLRMMTNLQNAKDNGWAAGTHSLLKKRDD